MSNDFDTGANNPPSEADVAEAVSALRGKSENELFETLRETTQAERDAGRMDDVMMESIYEKLAPMLSERQKERMREVIRRLKE